MNSVGHGTQMAMLIDGLLSLARLTRGKLQPERVDLSEVARAVIAELRAAEPERSLASRSA